MVRSRRPSTRPARLGGVGYRPIEWSGVTSTNGSSTRRTRSTVSTPIGAPCTPRGSSARGPSRPAPRPRRSHAPSTSRAIPSGAGPVLQRRREARGPRRRARGEGHGGEAASAGRRGDRHPRGHHARVRRADPGGVPRAAAAAGARSRDRAARHGEARRLPRRAPRVADGRPGDPQQRAARELRHPHLLLAARIQARRRRGRGHLGPVPVASRGGRGDDHRRRGPRARPRLPSRGARRTASARARPPSSSCFRSAAEDDPLDDPTAVWPDDRGLVAAGRLELAELVDDPESAGTSRSSTRADRRRDRASDDPILHARARAYSVSAYRRAESTSRTHPPRRPGASATAGAERLRP